MKKLNFAVFLLLFFLGLPLCSVWAQTRPIDYAEEYYENGEYEKAIDYYADIAKDISRVDDIYAHYLSALKKTGEYKDADKFLSKLIRKIDNNYQYRMDYILLLEEMGEEKDSKKELDDYLKDIRKNPALVEYSGEYFGNKGQWKKAEQVYLSARKASKNPIAYAEELSKVYLALDKIDQMLEEQFAMLKRNYASVETIEQNLQTAFNKQEDLDLLEKELFERIQKEPGFTPYNELLCWVYIQKKDFRKAFFQAKAIDRQRQGEPTSLMETGHIALKNEAYEEAITLFDYVVQHYAQSNSYATARKKLINAREEVVKNKYPVDTSQIHELVRDYRELIDYVGKNSHSVENLKNIALLKAFYLDEVDTGIALLKEVIAFPRTDKRLVAESKLALGDLYLLKGMPWESTLLYSQVEKANKMSTIGHEAKLRNARLSYFKGEFNLAQEHLDVLKMATSREIANDAMDLSILIQDNVGLDTSYEAMYAYAQVELQLFKKDYEQALHGLKQIQKDYPWHSLSDEIYWLRSTIYTEMNRYDEALTELEKIKENYASDLYGDDAFYYSGVIYEEEKADLEKAKEMYKKILFDYSDSIYSVDARKRYRRLRGDWNEESVSP